MAQLKDLLVMGPGRIIGDAFYGGVLMPTVTETQDIGSSSVKWNIVYAKTFTGDLSGNATTASYPLGFSSRASSFGWGNQTGTAVTVWNDSTGGSIGFRRDNPSGGKLSMSIDGRVYVSEGTYPVAAMRMLNNYWGMTDPDGVDSSWIRTTSLGLIPYSSDATNGASSLGTETWPFKDAYIKNVHGTVDKAKAANGISTQYAVAYYSDTSGTFAATAAATTGSKALVGSTTGPVFADISPTLTHTAGTSSAASKLKFAVLGQESDQITLTTASTSVYGMTKLSSSVYSSGTTRNTSSTLAATPSMVWGVIDTLKANDATVDGSGLTFIDSITQTGGIIAPHKKKVQTADADHEGIVSTEAQTFAGNKTFNGAVAVNNNISATGTLTVIGNVALNSSTQAQSLQAGSLLVSGNTSLVNTTTTSTVLPSANNTYNLGASGNAYAHIYATEFNGVADRAKAISTASTAKYAVIYTDDTAGTMKASNAGGTNTVFMGKGTTNPPAFVNVSSKLTISDANASNGQTISVTVLDVAGSASVTLAKATTSLYGVTKLSSTSSTSEEGLAATPKGVWTAINTLDYEDTSAQTNSTDQIKFVSVVTETDGKIDVIKANVREASTSQSGVVSTGTQGFAGDKTFSGNIVISGTQTVNGNVALNSSVNAGSLQAGSLLVSGNTSLVNTTTTSTLLPSANNSYNLGASGNKYATIYATTFDGVATKATAANISNTIYGVAYYSDNAGKFASTGQGPSNSVLVGNGAAAPSFTGISSQLNLTAGTDSAAPKLTVTVLGVTTSGKEITLTTAATDKYGVTKLTNSPSDSNTTLAMTPKGVNDAIAAKLEPLDFTSPSVGSSPAIEFIATVSETNGKIEATKQAVREASASVSGIVSTGTQGFAGNKTFSGNVVVSGTGTFNGNVALNSSVSADSLTAGSLLVSGNTSLVNTTTTSTILPSANNSYNIGASGNTYSHVYATEFNGTADKAKAANLTTAQYQLVYFNDSNGTFKNLALGSKGSLLYSNSSQAPTWLAPQTIGSVLYVGANSIPTWLAPSTSGYVLTTKGANNAPEWVDTANFVPEVSDALSAVNIAGNKHNPVYVDSSGHVAACTVSTDTGTQYIVVNSASTYAGIYNNGAGWSGIIVNDGTTTRYPVKWKIDATSVEVGSASTTNVYLTGSSIRINDGTFFLNNSNNFYLYRTSGQGSGNYIYFASGAGTSTISGSGTEYQYRTVQSFPAILRCELPYFATKYENGAVSVAEYVVRAQPQFYFRQYVHNASTLERTSIYEDFRLPEPTASRTSSAMFTILTSKNIISVGNGGTGGGTGNHAANGFIYYDNSGSSPAFKSSSYVTYDTTKHVLMGAAWNDYAEYRNVTTREPGRVVRENDNGILTVTQERLIAGASVISDTYGFAEGKTEAAQTPVAVAGRVLAYTYRDRNEYHAGMAVCSAPNGTVDIMTREEIMSYPDAIIGIVSEIPSYESWGPTNVPVNNRIWIKIK